MRTVESRRLARLERAALRRDVAAFARLTAWPDPERDAAWERVRVACLAAMGSDLTAENLAAFQQRYARDAAFHAEIEPLLRAYENSVARRVLGSDGDKLRRWLKRVAYRHTLLYGTDDAAA